MGRTSAPISFGSKYHRQNFESVSTNTATPLDHLPLLPKSSMDPLAGRPKISESLRPHDIFEPSSLRFFFPKPYSLIYGLAKA